MKHRTRIFVGTAVGILVLGLGTGLLANYAGIQNFNIIGGNGPDELSYVPSDARLVAFVDVHEITTSELREKMRQFEPSAEQKRQLETETGIDIERDVDRLVAAAWSAPTDGDSPPLILARGRFDVVRIEGLVREHGGAVEDYKGTRLLTVQPESAGRSGVSVAFVEPGLIAAGASAAVRQAIDTKQGGTNVTANTELMGLIKDVDDGGAWVVARFDALTPKQLPTAIAQQLPPISWFSASGHVDSGIQGTIRAEAKDEKSGEDLREVLRGFMALARLQVGQRAEFSEVVNSLELGGTGKTVFLRFAVPASVIDAVSAIASQRRLQPQVAPDQQVVPAPRAAVPSL